MTQEQCTEWILETIDQLRKRKARPDLERICHMVERKHGRSCDYIELELERLVEEGTVVKVEYKGNTSYRNAAKWKKGRVGGNVLNSRDVSRKIRGAIEALIEFTRPSDESAQCAQIGATAADLEEWFNTHEETNFLKSNLETALKREVNAGNLLKLDDGSYIIHETDKEKDVLSDGSPKDASSGKAAVSAGQKAASPGGGRRGRPAGKRKRIKKALPDFELEPPVKQPRPEEEENGPQASPQDLPQASPQPQPQPFVMLPQPAPRCDFCQMTAETNRKGVYEDLLICKDCQAKAHPSCMDYSRDLALRARTSPWQCIDCKTCYICQDSGDPDAMLFCDACDKGYHMSCHDPPVEEKPQGKWVCQNCSDELGIFAEDLQMEEGPNRDMSDRTTDVDGTSCLPTPRQSPVSFQEAPQFAMVNGGSLVNGHTTDLSPASSTGVPDASEWTIQDVAHYFEEKGFQEQAQAFTEQEIDGKSLLLMKRNDVLTGMSIKLGPALKIYNFVQKLQMRGEQV